MNIFQEMSTCEIVDMFIVTAFNTIKIIYDIVR